MPGIGAPMLTSGRKISSASRERPIAMPIATPTTRGEREAGRQAQQRVERVVRQDAVGGQPDEGRGDLFERRKQLARKDAELRDDLPDRADHQERKGVARNDAPAAFARERPIRRRRAPGSETVGAASVMRG